MSADWWQNFANNFAADLAPLLSLFGEQPTKQFLSETLDLVDIVIFSIAPIGVLTAVVSAIRVSEDPSLRAFIGRAQEGGAYAEAELCSSTSRDVCELYTTGGIARVFGRPKILEVVHVQPKDQDHETASKDQDPQPAGIYTFAGYVNQGEGSPEWTEKKKAGEKSFAIHPNLSLNIGIKKLPRPWFYLAATLGILLQGGVLVFAAIATYVYPDTFKRDDSQIIVPAFSLTLVGTILLCFGVGLCATVVESSTKERVFKRNKNSKCRLHWIQPGGQVIGDQVFDSFAYSEKSDNLLKEYTTSWKPDERTSKHDREQATKKKTLLVWTAIITTCVGFVLQFLGIRTLHSSVSVAQFVVMLIMSTIGALLRTQRLEKSDNQMGDSYTLYQGHELDWLAMKLACQKKKQGDGADKENNGDGRWAWQIVRPFEGFSHEAVDLSENISRVSSIHGLSADLGSGPDLQEAFLKRARLARLTGAQSLTNISITCSSWGLNMIASRELASSLAKAIESTMALFQSESTFKSDWEKASKICWSIPCGKHVIGEKSGSQLDLVNKPGRIRFTLSRHLESTDSSWKADKSELEAALGLWLWSLRLKDRVQSSSEISEEVPASFLPCSRIVFSHEETDSQAGEPKPTPSVDTSVASNEVLDLNSPFPAKHSRSAEANLELWLGSRRLTLFETTLRIPPDAFIPSEIVKPLKEYRKKTSPEVSSDGHEEEKTGHKPRRLFGFQLLPKSATTETNVRVLEVLSQGSLETMCAQEIFSAFLVSISPMLHQIGDKTSIVKDSDKVHLENQCLSDMIRNFTASGIGSEEDALTCIVPILHHQGKLVHSMDFTESIEAADAYRKRNEWAKAEQVLLCALCLSLQTPESYVIIQKGLSASTKYTKEQNMCLLALFDLYRWALLGDRHSRLFGLRGILSICKEHDFKLFSNEVFDYLDAAFALCSHRQDDPAIRQLSEEFRKEFENGTMSAGISRKINRHISRDRDEHFQAALRQRDLARTLYLLKGKVFSFCPDPPALIYAAQNGWGTVLKNLLELGANPEEADQNGLNYLHHASGRIANPETFLQLVGNQSYLLNRTDKRGMTSLHLAAKANQKKIIEILLDQFSLDPYQWDLSMISSLEYAVSERRSEISSFLITWTAQMLHECSSNIMWDALMQIAILVATTYDNYFLNKFLIDLRKERYESESEDIKKTLDGFHETCKILHGNFAEKKMFRVRFPAKYLP